MPRTLLLVLFIAASWACAPGEALAQRPRKGKATAAEPGAMPLTGLKPAVAVPDLCVYHYPVSTRSPECQRFCDQGFGYFYSYVWMEAARSFETALAHDPECASAWLGLHRALEKWGKGTTPTANPLLAVVGSAVQSKLPDRFTKSPRDYALESARKLMPRANHREQLLIQARLQEKGMWPDVKPDERRKKAQASLDELLTLYEDDEEGWFWRAQIAEGPNAGTPFYKALLRINPYHPGANHELVHFYENIRRPALGWPYAEGYMKSSPAIPHAFHMQAHLAMRVGKWQNTTDWSSKAIALERSYHKYQGVSPKDDFQFQHHLETLTRSLVHDGRFAEAKKIQAEAVDHNFHFRPEWFRMAVTQKDWAEAEKIVDHFRKSDRLSASYHAAVIALEQGNADLAAAHVDVLRQALQTKKSDRRNELRLWEVQGRLMCQTGQGEAGAKLIRRAVDKTKDDFAHHSWGGGAYYMEVWGVAALEAGLAAEADEAFQEALAHDAGSVRGALGMWALCQRVGRTEEAGRYLKVALRCWNRADPVDFERLRDDYAKKALHVPHPNIVTAAEGEQ
jgi:tetratricopeptide (TPR) repeat protein